MLSPFVHLNNKNRIIEKGKEKNIEIGVIKMIQSIIHLFFALLAICSGSAIGSIYNKKFEESIPITVMGSIIFLYVFYIFNHLFMGLYILWGIMLFCYIFFLYKFIKSTKEERISIIKNIFTPGAIIFITVFCLITLITRGRYVFLWDELRLWGAYPKILYYDGSLQLGENIQLMPKMQSYEPGMPLFQFLFAKSAGIFTESNLFLAYGILGAIVFIPLTKKITWKKWYLIPIYSFLIFMLPLALANSQWDGLVYYYTLYIDPMLGIYFAYTLYLASINMIDKKYKFLLFGLGISTLVLLKDTGIVFAIISAISFMVNSIINMKRNKEKVRLKNIIYVGLPLIIIGLIFGSWKSVQKKYNTQNMYSTRIEKSEINEFLKSPSEEQRQMVEDFKKELKTSTIIISTSEKITEQLTYKNLMILLFIFFTMLVIFKGRNKRKETIVTIIMYFLGSAIFTVGTLGVYVFSLHIVTCFPRYMTTLFVAGFILLFLLIIEDLLDGKIKEKYKFYISIIVIIIIMILPVKLPLLGAEPLYKKWNEEGSIYSEHIRSYLSNRKKESITLIFSMNHYSDFSYDIYCHQIYMDLIDEGFEYLDSYFIDQYSTKEKDNNYLRQYEYAYFIVIDEADKEIFNSYLNNPVENSTLFKINSNGEELRLEKME